MFKTIFKGLGFLLLLLLAIFFMGDKPDYDEVSHILPTFEVPLAQLESYVADQDAKVKDLKPGNGGQIVWASEPGVQTEYVMLYLHGFSASHEEGNPLHRKLAKRYGCNLYLPRLEDHGRFSEESFVELTPKNYMDSALDALNVAKVLGKKVILLGCSTGATLGVFLAAHHQEDIVSLLLYSPNIDLHDPNAQFLTWPWGLKLAQQIKGSQYNTVAYNDKGSQYWNAKYRLEGVVAVKGLINQTMTPKVFKAVKQPVFMASYYKNDEVCDKVVSYTAMQNFYNNIATPENQKEWKKYPDVRGHVFISEVFSDDVQRIIDDASVFIEATMQLKPVEEKLWVETTAF